MILRIVRLLTLTVGAALLALGLAQTGPGGAALAQGLPPRPTVVPPAPTDQPAENNHSGHATPTAPGRITGTVIDTRTGAPTPGVPVRVGETLVQSDANGNYDLNGLAPGSYTVALALAPGQGAPAQGAVTVVLAAGQTVVQHLFFSTTPPVAPPAAPAPPAEAPVAPAPPASLPDTSGRGGSQIPLLIFGAALITAGAALRRRG